MGPERRIGLLMTALDANSRNADGSPASRGRTLWTACAAHALHDGYTDLIYLLLPIWQAEFGLGYGALAFLRGLAAATIATLLVLPSVFALVQARAHRRSSSLDPDDPASSLSLPVQPKSSPS